MTRAPIILTFLFGAALGLAAGVWAIWERVAG